MKVRELTAFEANIVSQVKVMNDLIEKRKLVASITVEEKAAELMVKYAKPFRAELNKKTGKYLVCFGMTEFVRYTHWCLKLVKIKVLIDGSLETSDGVLIPMEHWK